MDTASILSAIDSEIDRLQRAKAILTGLHTTSTDERSPGRPKAVTVPSTRKKRTMSAEGKARIAAAQKKRWAEKNAGK